MTTHMAIYEVFALNIMPSQLKSICSMDKHTPEGLEAERKHFLHFMKEKWNLGWRWENQLIAWQQYVDLLDSVEFSDEELETSWVLELGETFENQARAGNYNEFGGQQ